MSAKQTLLALRDATARSTMVFLRDVGHGLLEVSHNTLALLGLIVVALGAFAYGQPALRHTAELELFGWLQARQEARTDPETLLAQSLAEPTAIARATAADSRELTKPQALVSQWISKRYRVASEPINRLVKEAWSVGERAGLDPTLILAIMAIESSYNPFAQSSVGAQGLMQVMTRVHDDKYERFGGSHAAFDPVTNLRVGVQVLKECISRAGGLEAGLRYYVGAANLDDDGGYAGRVLAEQNRLKLVAAGKAVPTTTPALPPVQPAAVTPSPSVPTLPAQEAERQTAPTAAAAPSHARDGDRLAALH